ncbi:hypothetical protein vBPmiSPMCJR_075 [Proteus phage vB_PmiS_PM-CJR]|nr:hypothetical protein vBPmiSPMCJR_075 [Proteus phage vB_PmiS_PM-CJR]
MNYTIVWNENKTEGVIFSGESAKRDIKMAKTGNSNGMYSTLAGEFYDTYGEYEPCTSVSLCEPTQEMIDAGNKALYSGGEQSVERIYKAMIQKLTCNL